MACTKAIRSISIIFSIINNIYVFDNIEKIVVQKIIYSYLQWLLLLRRDNSTTRNSSTLLLLLAKFHHSVVKQEVQHLTNCHDACSQ